MAYHLRRGDLNEINRILDPYTHHWLIRMDRESHLQYIKSTFLDEINNAPIKPQFNLYSKDNKQCFSIQKHDVFQERYSELNICLEEHLNLAMKLCNMLRIDHPKHGKELSDILEQFKILIDNLIRSPSYFEENTDINNTCEQIIKMVEDIKSLKKD